MPEINPLELEVQTLLNEYNTLVGSMPDEWVPTWPQTELSIRVYVHLAEILDGYVSACAAQRKATIRLRGAMRGVRRQMKAVMLESQSA